MLPRRQLCVNIGKFVSFQPDIAIVLAPDHHIVSKTNHL